MIIGSINMAGSNVLNVGELEALYEELVESAKVVRLEERFQEVTESAKVSEIPGEKYYQYCVM